MATLVDARGLWFLDQFPVSPKTTDIHCASIMMIGHSSWNHLAFVWYVARAFGANESVCPGKPGGEQDERSCF